MNHEQRFPFAYLYLSIGLLGFGLGIVLAFSSSPASAQRGFQFDEAFLRQMGTKHSLPMVAGPRGSAAEGQIVATNTGWEASDVLVVELLRAPAPGCDPAGTDAARILHTSCHEDLGRFQSASIPLSGEDNVVRVYSFHSEAEIDACGALEAVQSGDMSLVEWEQQVHLPAHGEPLVVKALAQSAQGALAAMVGQTSLNMPLVGELGRINVSQTLAISGENTNTAGRAFNAAAECASTRNRLGGEDDTGDCSPIRERQVEIGALDSVELNSASGKAGGSGLWRSGRQAVRMLEIATAAEHVDERGWSRYKGNTLYGPASGIMSFPIAYYPLPNAEVELVVVNDHMTDTVKVNLVMYDGAGAVWVNYKDPIALCPGQARRYDIVEIAGEIPTARGRGDQPGPPQMSMRLEAQNSLGTEFAQVAAALTIRSDIGNFSYEGLNLPYEANILRNTNRRTDNPINATGMVAIVPDVKLNFGDRRETSVIGIVQPGAQSNENNVIIDFYDAEGNLVLERFQRPIRPVALVDLAQVAQRGGDGGAAQRLPNGFRGTAVIRGLQNPYSPIRAVAFDRPPPGDSTGRGPDRLASVASVMLLTWFDPSLPTPTPRPTRLPPSPTPRDVPPSPEVTPTEAVEMTPDVFLPLLMQGWLPDEG